jgi:hypothetical protein
VKTYLTQYFKKVLQGARAPRSQTTARRKVGLTHYGEALTSDEVYHRLRDQAAKKAKSKPAVTTPVSKVKKSGKAPVARFRHATSQQHEDENICQRCGPIIMPLSF